ncbi:hypothetical protein MPER_07263, partial [Moniliophthora perniciosa FA553]
SLLDSIPNDSLYAQILVYCVYLLETAQTISLTYNAFQSLVFGFEDFVSLTKIYGLWLDTYAFDGLVALIFQVYFANKIRILLSNARIIPGIIVLLALAQFAGSIGSAITFESAGVFPAYVEVGASSSATDTIPGYLWTGCGMLADVLIAVTMVYALSQYDTTFRKTQGLVKRLSQLMMEIGGLSRIHILGARGTTKKNHLTPNPNQNPIPTIQLTGPPGNSSETSAWIPTTFPSRLDFDMDSAVLMNTLDSKQMLAITAPPL